MLEEFTLNLVDISIFDMLEYEGGVYLCISINVKQIQ